MSLFDALTGRHKLSGPAPDRLFALSTARVTLEAEHAIKPRGAAGLVFQALSSADFQSTLAEMEQVVSATAADSATEVRSEDDSFGFRWMLLRGPDLEDLLVGVNAVASALESGGYGERLLAAVFAFVDAQDAPLYFIYNYKRGHWYPFVPAPGPGQERNTERELQLKAQLGSELPIEPELERWFALWGIPI